ncbi:MAG: hypothetical protein WCO55_01885 [Candidatus Falkowbacteria bacterium]
MEIIQSKRLAVKMLENLLTLAKKSQSHLIITSQTPNQATARLSNSEAEFELNGPSAESLLSALADAGKNPHHWPVLAGWQLSSSAKPKTYIIEPLSQAHQNSLEDLIFDPASKRALYETLMEGGGVIALSEMDAATAAQLASLLAQMYGSDSYHLLSIADQHHLNLPQVQRLAPQLINQHSFNLKDFDADLIYWGSSELPAQPEALWHLADAHLIIINLGPAKVATSTQALADRLDWQMQALNQIKHIITVRPLAAICPDCRAPYQLDHALSNEHSDWLGIPAESLHGNSFYYGQGCPACEHSGSGGIRLVAEAADCRQIAPNRQAWRQFFADPPHKTWREIALDKTLDGTFSLEELQKIF